jgi:GNAT superfamily N-acetyltransferase
MPILYRPARAEELQECQQLIVGSINDLSERHGFGKMASVRTPDFQLFSLNDDPAGLWTAEEDGRIVGCAFSWVAERLWFLAELFIAPDRQGQRIGQELLKRTFAHASASGADCNALITFTFNRVSQALYIRHGMYPRWPIYMVSAPREVIVQRGGETALTHVALERSPAHLDTLESIDRSALGFSRRKHHAYLLGEGATKGFLLRDVREPVGYAYVNQGGHIGPFAVTSADAAGPAFRSALSLALQANATQVSAFIPGPAEAPLRIAMEHGMQITLPMVLMSSRDFGDWSRYLPRNPGFM